MKSRGCHLVLTLAGAMLLAQAASAETFRCGQWIASKDMTVEELLEKCGEPTTKSVRHEDNYAKSAGGGTHRVGTSTIETWTYDRGSESFAMIVTIVDGKIKSMERDE
jgi:Protein of unknown function (DUF2845)